MVQAQCCAVLLREQLAKGDEGLREILDRFDQLQAWCEAQNGERSYDIDNVLAERLYRLEITDEPPENYPAERLHHEQCTRCRRQDRPDRAGTFNTGLRENY